MTEMQLRNLIVSTAAAHIGYNEKDGSHRKIVDTYNAHKPLAQGYAVKYTDEWCATFGSFVAIKAGLTDIIPTECGCERQIKLFQQMGCWQENDAYIPEPGDYIYYHWKDGADYAATDCTGWADHVGIVERVQGNVITVIEGNKADAVGRRNLSINGRYVRGFGTPNYIGKAKKENTATNAAVDKLARLGVINSPELWKDEAASGEVEYLGKLIENAACVITRAGKRTETAEEGILALVEAGVISTPEYWLKNYKNRPNLGALLCALGGSVK